MCLAWVALAFQSAITWPGSLVRLAGLTIAVIFLGIPRQRFVALFTKHFGWIPVLFGALTLPYWHWYVDTYGRPSNDFFATAAAILPVILLAAVVDVRRSQDLKSHQLALPIFAVFLGELAALNEVAFGTATVGNGFAPQYLGDFMAVSSSFVTVTIALILAVLADFRKPRVSKGSSSAERNEQGHLISSNAETASGADIPNVDYGDGLTK
jgi:hypothetical protein